MFNKDFYPTPEKIIMKMVEGLDFMFIKTILEPSAGKGNIVDYLEKYKERNNSYYKKYHYDIDCIEIEPDLQAILDSKKYKVVFDDFLKYETYKEYDLIIANVPFSNGAKHLLKMIEMQKRNGGYIVALCNAETIRNVCNNDRFLLQKELSDCGADISFIENAFEDAERRTNVEIALIKAKLESKEKKSILIEGLEKGKKEKDITYSNDGKIVKSNFLESIVDQFKFECEAGIKLIHEYQSMQNVILSSFGKDENGNTVQKGGCIINMSIDKNIVSVNDFIVKVREKYWKALFSNEEFIKKLTSNLRKEFMKKVDDLKNYDFSMFNIKKVQEEINKNTISGVEDTILSLFEELSYEHSYFGEGCKNVHYYNGWKTNKSYLINRKVIIPLSAYKSWSYHENFKPTWYDTIEKLKDIEKVFNYLDKGRTEPVDLNESLKRAEKDCVTKNIDTKYFTITFYKKGTTHLVFKDEDLLKKFNLIGSKSKGWLPFDYGNKAYEDFTSEEKKVIKEFNGNKNEYERIRNDNFFKISKSDMLLLE